MYPPAPWKARGFMIQTLRLIDIEQARPYVPPSLEIVVVALGKTVGSVYFADYGPGSALTYNELIVAPALTRHGSTLRFWISHIYVDSEESMAGGREIWGLPKEMAHFTWSQDRRAVEARQDARLLCRLSSGAPRWLLPMPIFLPTFGILKGALLSFTVSIRGRLGLAQSQLDVPPESPFNSLKLAARGLALPMREITFVAPAPRVVARLKRDTASTQP